MPTRAHSGAANESTFQNARRDHQAIAGKREALAILPNAWAELVAEGHVRRPSCERSVSGIGEETAAGHFTRE